jgi:hypothetical protein
VGERRKKVITIHCEPNIEWQGPFAHKMQQGLNALGITNVITRSRTRESETAILLGTTFWRGIEASGDYLLVDRCSFFDTNEWVSLVWNGHGRRGDHKVPKLVTPRYHPIPDWWRTGNRRVLCGQTEPYSPHYSSLNEWYSMVDATHFRTHPAGNNPTGLPRISNFDDCGLAITLNSSIGVEAVIAGIPTVTMDEAAMAYDVTSHDGSVITPDRRPWLEWISWTQWHHNEIRDGHPIRHLFEEI